MDDVDPSAGWSIGRLSRASGLPVKTIRFYSDAGLLPASRTPTGHRRYAASDLARLHLIRSLRALDIDLLAIADLLTDTTDLRQVLARHADTLQVRLEAVQRQLAVARAAADAPIERTLDRLQILVRLEAAERDRLLERFWNRTLEQTLEEDAAWFRSAGVPSLPVQPTEDQIDAWLELVALAADPDFQQATRASAEWFADHSRPDLDMQIWQEELHEALALAREAHDRSTHSEDHDEPVVLQAVDAYVTAHARAFAQEATPAFARWLNEQLTALGDPRVERWWHLVAQVQSPGTAPRRDPYIVAWLHEALARAVA